MSSDSFPTNHLVRLEQKMLPTGRRPQAKRHFLSGETEVYISEPNTRRLKHPPYSPDLAPSDFYLFPTIKEKLKDIQMVDEEDLFYRLQELLNGISCKELDKVFGTWINRLMIVSQGDGT
jgi:hypothetical protein